MRPTWEESFMLHAILAATRSSCLVRQVGAVLVKEKRIIASGYNGAPPGVETCLHTGVCFYQNLAHQDSLKGLGTYEELKEQRKEFCSAVHAEKNALNQCTIHGVSPAGGTLYITNFPCPGCVRDVVIPNKIAEIVVWKSYLQNRLLTMDEYEVSRSWLGQAGIEVKKFELTEARMQEIFASALSVGNRLPYRFEPPPPAQE
jgi:dCMP deaminase